MFKYFKSGFQKIKNALKKTSKLLSKKLGALFSEPIDPEKLEDLERILYEADLGSSCVTLFLEEIEDYHTKNPDANGKDYLNLLATKAEEILSSPAKAGGTSPLSGTPKILLIIGVNGSGKTTTIAKLAKHYQDEGKKILVAAGDTFRAAAIEQLDYWAKKAGVDIVKGMMGGDPSAVVYDAIEKGRLKGYDLVICDTAGRLESKSDLMKELEKIARVAKKQDELAPHETYLVIDTSLGQTAIEQARIFNDHVPLTGFILTKVDGSAKGGIALPLYQELGIPIRFLGCGEKIDDLLPFDAKAYAEGLFLE